VEILVVILLLLVFGLGGWVAFIEYRYSQLARSFRLLMTGRSGADLETTLHDFVGRMGQSEQLLQTIDHRLSGIEIKQPFQVQHVGEIGRAHV
jgi:hypothetical protein